MKHKEGQKPYLSLKGIDRFFGITKALQKVDLDIYEGEVIGLVGPNRSRKIHNDENSDRRASKNCRSNYL